jgi:seryl-tRNA synthetase
MLDIRLIREKPDYVKERLASRSPELVSVVDEILDCDRQRRAAETRFQQLQSERKRVSKEIGMRRAKGEDTSQVEAEVRALGEEIATLEDDARNLETGQRLLLLNVPNLPHDACPRGTTAEDNPVVRTWGEKKEFSFAPKVAHRDRRQFGLFSFERAAKITGSAFVCYMGLERGWSVP